jgi:hypothetical protein
MREGMSEMPELEGGFASAGGMEAIHLRKSVGLEPYRLRLNQSRALVFCLDALSSREPASSSLENALKLVSKSNELTRRPGNHASIAKLVRDGIAATGLEGTRFQGTFGLQPGLGHGTRDNVPLDPFAFRARKRSQILAGAARLNRRELHWRTARRALRTLVLSVKHGPSPVWAGA